MYAIEKNVPFPNQATMGRKYGWEQMEVGDSIFVPESAWPEGKSAENMRVTIYNAARKYGAPRGISYKSLIVTEKKPNPVFQEIVASGGGLTQDGISETIEVTGIRTWMMSGPVAEPIAPAPDPIRTDEGDQTKEPQV